MQKLILKPRETKSLNFLNETESFFRLSVFSKGKNDFKKIYGRKIMNHKKKRGIFLIKSEMNSLQVMPIIDSGSSELSDALGFEEYPTLTSPEVEDGNGTKLEKL